MGNEALAGRIQTVLGAIDPGKCGNTLVHEHLLEDLTVYYSESESASERMLSSQLVRMENLSWVRSHPNNNRDNLLFTDEGLAIRESMLFKLAGGATIVEVTNRGVLGRDPLGLARIARATGLHIVMGTGYYVSLCHPAHLADDTEELIAEDIAGEILVGVNNTGICAGIIGEVGCSTPLEDSERKVLRCCAAAQRMTGAAIYLHPSSSDSLVLENVCILKDAGADLSRIIVGHVDISGFSSDTLHRLADMGCSIGYDSFGSEGFFQLPHQTRFVEICDVQRVNDIIKLIKDGYLDRILLSQDIAMKHRLVSYGGEGYAHILRNIVPMMRIKGLSDGQIKTMLVDNPRRLLSIVPYK